LEEAHSIKTLRLYYHFKGQKLSREQENLIPCPFLPLAFSEPFLIASEKHSEIAIAFGMVEHQIYVPLGGHDLKLYPKPFFTPSILEASGQYLLIFYSMCI